MRGSGCPRLRLESGERGVRGASVLGGRGKRTLACEGEMAAHRTREAEAGGGRRETGQEPWARVATVCSGDQRHRRSRRAIRARRRAAAAGRASEPPPPGRGQMQRRVMSRVRARVRTVARWRAGHDRSSTSCSAMLVACRRAQPPSSDGRLEQRAAKALSSSAITITHASCGDRAQRTREPPRRSFARAPAPRAHVGVAGCCLPGSTL